MAVRHVPLSGSPNTAITNAAAGRFALDAIAGPYSITRSAGNPELLSGGLYKPLDTAVPQQFFAT